MTSDLESKGSSAQGISSNHRSLIHFPRSSRSGFATALGFCTVSLLLLYVFYRPTMLLYGPPNAPSPHDHPKEAYVTFLADIEEPWYNVSARLLTFQLRHDPLTRDTERDLVVLTTPLIPPGFEDQLRAEGAVVMRRDLIKGMPGQDEAAINCKDQYTKLHVFNLTMFDRVVYLDNDMILNEPMSGVWDDPGAWPASGLASLSLSGQDHETPPANDGDYFNGNFWVARPSTEPFEALLQVRDYDTVFQEQVSTAVGVC